MINDIMDYGKIQNKKLKLAPIQFNLLSAIQDILDIINPIMQKSQVCYETVNMIPERECSIINDINRIK